MEEKVKVTYRGRMYEVTKHGSSYSLGTGRGYITNSADGWRLTEVDGEHPEDFFWLKYGKDGYMEWANDMMRRPGRSDGKYNPDYTDMGFLDEPARKLYHIAKQVEAYEKLGVAPAEVLELRYRMMGMTLKMLGYRSIDQVLHGEPNSDVALMDLDRVVKFIEKYPAFAQYITKGGYSSSPTVDMKIPEDIDKEKFKQEFDAAKAALEEEEQYYSSRAEFWGNLKHPMIKPDFCSDMKDKVSSHDWADYSETVKKLAKVILSLNADLLAPAEKMSLVQMTSLDKMEVEHQIFLVTQAPEMDDAITAESYFFISEVDALDQKMKEDLKDDRTRNSTPGKLMQQFVTELQEEVGDRKKGIERRDYYRNVYPYDKKRKKISPRKRDDEDPRYGD